ncbi:bifunctional 2-C-methyl-D-erythritol 4-phosphate cytidylyltransferase/2-C-methyl-D-erythritol 2,4-cyclodiphosphate synthase [Nitrosophilus kaiyonis]|uniref:bifunctional 2-C-methyl-D-erythritol 4-phosphate cytidylyltransferase/2-C-methyl-D-erythritol 2,4-cyclodiphosphate synthase n=1 Tax=Nitrosophilus kaiyonis TaxID=2930200 RepID=UPI00249057EB|nr:bifunctional 2-C-methyl-D-erythritol 4-phosphate cytidylyltransferase/2-C-methyl-D-erythritol 2,4-cyclodiphosphate synthase [Nitrosophilus kaiyonis]
MSDLSLVLLGAGESSRFKLKTKKQWLRVENWPIWQFVAKRFENFYKFKKIVITASDYELKLMQNMAGFTFVKGGKTRQESLINALEHIDSDYVLVSDIARVCINKEFIEKITEYIGKADCIAPYINVSDTVVYKNETIDREEIKLIQTPQLSNTKILKEALSKNIIFTDESSAIKWYGGKVEYIEGDKTFKKLTYIEDLEDIKCLKPPAKDIFTGNGFDIHPFVKNKPLMLGGVEITKEYGFKGHSDGDVLIHSIIDALLGAAGYGDIGEFFPDNEEKYKNIDSKILLKEIVEIIEKTGFEIVNIDATIITQKPKISPFKNEIKNSLSKILNLDKSKINIKATTTEKMGFIGREEGTAVLSSANLKYFDWTSVLGGKK